MQSLILQKDSLCWPQIRDNQRVLELWVCAWVEAVHSTEPLAGRPTTEHLHVTLLRQLLSKRVGFLSRHDQLQKDITVLCENCGARIVQPEGLSGRIPHLYGPISLWDSWCLGKEMHKQGTTFYQHLYLHMCHIPQGHFLFTFIKCFHLKFDQ